MSDLFRSVLNGSGSDPLVGSTVEAGQYRLQVKSKIAEGGFACIYQATNESSGEALAVKRLLSNDAERKQDAIREASLLRKMNHKNIVKFVTAAQMGNNAAGYEELLVVMEWCPAGVPDLLRERGGFLDRQETTKVFYQACSAIGVLHKMSPPAVHRDIKGENLLISTQGIIKLCDFGSVTTQTFTPDDSWNHMQRTKVEEDSQRATTPAYRAPEICDLYSNYPIDKRQDMWALGCLLVLLTTGKHPFEMGEKLAIINGRYSPSSKPEHAPFASVVKQLLVLDPRKRCQTIPDLMDAVRAIADNSAGNINPSDPISPIPRKKESTPPRMGSPDQLAGEGGFGHSNGGSMSQSDIAAQASNMLGKASKIGSGLFSKLKSGINDLTDHTLDYAAQKGWDQTLRSNVGINLPRSGPKHSQAPQGGMSHHQSGGFQEYRDFNEFENDLSPPDPSPPVGARERKNSIETPKKVQPPSGGNFFDTLDWNDSSSGGAQTSAPAAPAPAASVPAPVVGDLLGGSSAPPQPTAQPISSDPFAQWTSSTSNNANSNAGSTFDSFDPFASAPAPQAGGGNDSGPNLMGDWNASNILQNQGKANFSHIQQQNMQQSAKPHDPFANLTQIGSTLPPTQRPVGQQQQQRPMGQQHQQRPMGQQPMGVSSSGAWGATFQTRPQAAQNQAGGWNANSYMQTNTQQYKQQQQAAQAPPKPAGGAKGGSGAFDNLLDGFGSNFGQKAAAKNQKMGDLKKQTDNKYRDPIDVKVEEWSKGRETNVRGLLASLHEVLWEGHNWKPISVGDLLQPPAVKKAYRRACLVVHPDKHTGQPNEKLARAIFMQLSESYTKFEENPSM